MITIKPKTKSEKLSALKVEYDPQFKEVNLQIAIAVASSQNATTEATYRDILSQLLTEYNAKKAAILNG